jgi:hypothetical protein
VIANINQCAGSAIDREQEIKINTYKWK